MRRDETPEGRSVRLLRVGEQVRHALSEVLMRGDVHDETLASHSVSITEVRIHRDSGTHCGRRTAAASRRLFPTKTGRR